MNRSVMETHKKTVIDSNLFFALPWYFIVSYQQIVFSFLCTKESVPFMRSNFNYKIIIVVLAFA